MDVDKELKNIERLASGQSLFKIRPNKLQSIAINENVCREIAKYFDVEVGGECSPVRYVQQVMLEIDHDMKIAAAERALERARGKY